MTVTPSARGERAQAELVTDPRAFEELREEWNELLQDSASDGFFLTWEWMHSWWKHLGANRKLFIIAIRAGARLVGLAPLAIRGASPLAVPPLRCVELLGSGIAGSDYLDLIARRGWEKECAAAFASRLGDEGTLAVLNRLRTGSAFAQALVAELSAQGWRARESRSEVCPFVPRPPGGFAEYLASRGPEHRYAFRRKVQALHKRHQVSFEAVREEKDRAAALDTLIELHARRWSRKGTSEAFNSRAMLAFHHEVTALALARGWLRLFVLRADGVPVAALYGFRYGRTFYFYQSGFDPIWGKQSVGLVTMGLAIESAFDEGVDEFDLLHGDEAYKFHWASGVHQLSRVELHPAGARGLAAEGICVAAQLARGAVRKLAERLRGVPARKGAERSETGEEKPRPPKPADVKAARQERAAQERELARAREREQQKGAQRDPEPRPGEAPEPRNGEGREPRNAEPRAQAPREPEPQKPQETLDETKEVRRAAAS